MNYVREGRCISLIAPSHLPLLDISWHVLVVSMCLMWTVHCWPVATVERHVQKSGHQVRPGQLSVRSSLWFWKSTSSWYDASKCLRVSEARRVLRWNNTKCIRINVRHLNLINSLHYEVFYLWTPNELPRWCKVELLHGEVLFQCCSLICLSLLSILNIELLDIDYKYCLAVLMLFFLMFYRKRLRMAEGMEFGSEVYKITFEGSDKHNLPLFGAKYHFMLEGVVDCPEFLVYFPLLKKLVLYISFICFQHAKLHEK